MASRINFDPDRPQLDGRNLAGLVDAYLRELPLRGPAPAFLTAYPLTFSGWGCA